MYQVCGHAQVLCIVCLLYAYLYHAISICTYENNEARTKRNFYMGRFFM